MNRLALAALMAVAALSLQACVSIKLSPAGPYSAGKLATYTLGQDWNDLTPFMGAPKGVRVLTLDGPLLNRLYLTDGLAVGQPLVKAVSKERPTPVYRKAMSATEQVEFVTDSVKAMGYQSAEASGLSRAEVSGKTGVRFEIKAMTPDGLEISGIGQVVEAGDHLYVAVFLAPTEHYYKAGQAEALQVLGSLRAL